MIAVNELHIVMHVPQMPVGVHLCLKWH